MLDRFYLIIDSTRHLEAFLNEGLRCVQLRIKDCVTAEQQTGIRSEIRHARQLCDQFDCQLIINDYWQIAIDEGCDAVHLGQEDLDTADIEQLKRNGIKYGLSTHDKAELARAMALAPDYIALGPIHATLLKKMPWRPQGLEKLTRWKKAIGSTPLVAIGGFTPERAMAAFEHGADSVCVVTDVVQHSDPVERVKQWLSLTRETPTQTL